jgi:hypothetical protein
LIIDSVIYEITFILSSISGYNFLKKWLPDSLNLFSNGDERKPDAEKNNGNAYGIGNGHAYGNTNGNGHSYGYGNGYDGKPNSDIGLPLLPVFRQSDPILEDSILENSRAIHTVPTDEAEMYGILFLPILTGFTENTEGFTVGDPIVLNYSGIEVDVQTYLDEFNNIIYFFDLGETKGNITLVMHPDDTFDYYQNTIPCLNDDYYFYVRTEMTNGIIFPQDEIYGYEILGELFWTDLAYNIDLSRTYIRGSNSGHGSLRVKTNDKIVIGFPVPRFIDYNSLPSDIPSNDNFFVSNNNLEELTVLELQAKNEFIKSLQYLEGYGFPFHDIYYVLSTNSFHYYLLDNYINYLSEENFKELIGYSFADLGYADCNDLVMFLAEYFSLDYVSFKPDSNAEWRIEEFELYNSMNEYYVIDFTIEEDGVYYIGTEVPGILFNIQGESIGGSNNYESLIQGNYYYALWNDNYTDFAFPEYLYLMRIEDI